MSHRTWFLIAAAAALAAAVGAAATSDTTERPFASEECVARCDDASDKCMAAAGGDERKAKACDDQYAECLQKCR
jgi:hypothetical protein